MPSLRIASIGASIASARINRTPWGSCRLGCAIRSPTRGAIRTSASSASRVSASIDGEGELEALAVERELGAALPERGEEDDQHPRGALPRLGGDRLAAGLEVGRGDAGGVDRVARGDEGRDAAKLFLALEHEARGQRLIEGEGRLGPVLLGYVEGDLGAAGDQGAEANGGVGGQPLQGLVEEEVTHVPRLPPGQGRSCACTVPCRLCIGRLY